MVSCNAIKRYSEHNLHLISLTGRYEDMANCMRFSVSEYTPLQRKHYLCLNNQPLKTNTTMLGAIIGDILGSRFEFGNAPRKGFELFTNECCFTDDTICTIAVADAVLNERSYQEALLEWCARYPQPMGGYGYRFESWLHSPDSAPTDSFGNGSAMRVSSIGWLFDDFHTVLDEAARSAKVSHSHPQGIKGAQCVAASIYWLRTCRVPKDELETAVSRRFGYEIPSLRDVYKIGSEGHFDATCQETVPMALRCFLHSESFEDAIRLAVLAGGDTDTKAAITGSIAEAHYDLPEKLIEQTCTRLPKEMLAVLEQFYNKIETNIHL